MTTTELATRPAAAVRSTWLVPVLVGVATWSVSGFAPLMSPLILALMAGAVVANTSLSRAPRVAAAATSASFLLRLGVALLGLRLAVSDIASLGLFGILLVLLTVACTFAVTRWCGARLGLERDLVSLIACGFSVCGAAAIAAVQDGVRARKSAVGLALALVTIHGSVMLALIPLLGRVLSLEPDTVAIWAGASIHEVAQVAAAASLIGPGALALAMATKLGRVCLLAVVHHAATRGDPSGTRSALGDVPWFLYAFVGAVLLRATGLVPEPAIAVANHASSICLAAGMFGLGLGLVLRELWPIPGRVIALSCVATATVTGVPLLLLVVSGAA